MTFFSRSSFEGPLPQSCMFASLYRFIWLIHFRSILTYFDAPCRHSSYIRFAVVNKGQSERLPQIVDKTCRWCGIFLPGRWSFYESKGNRWLNCCPF